MATYPAGSVVFLNVTFTSSGVAADPSTITLYVRGPGGLTTYVYTGASGIQKLGTGQYQLQYQTTNSGEYFYRWTGAGSLIAANESTFIAGPSNFV